MCSLRDNLDDAAKDTVRDDDKKRKKAVRDNLDDDAKDTSW